MVAGEIRVAVKYLRLPDVIWRTMGMCLGNGLALPIEITAGCKKQTSLGVSLRLVHTLQRTFSTISMIYKRVMLQRIVHRSFDGQG